MLNNTIEKIGTIEVIIIIFAITLGERLISLPLIAVSESGYGSILSILLGGLLLILVAYIFSRLLLNYTDKDITEFSEDILGKLVSKIIIFIFFIYFLLFASLFIRRVAEFAKQELLIRTPLEIIILTFIFLVAYCASGGVPIYAKVSDLLVSLALIAIIVLICVSTPFIQIQEIYPAFQTASFKEINLLFPGLATFMGFEIILFLVPYMKKPTDIKKASLISGILLVVFFLIDIVYAMGILTKEVLQYKIYPIFDIAKLIDFLGYLDIRFDVIFTGLWLLLVYSVLVGYSYLFSRTITSLVKLKSHSVFIFLLLPFMYVISLIPQSLGQINTFLDFLEKIWIFGIIGSVLFMYVFGIITKRIKA